MKYRTYRIHGQNAYAIGYKLHYPSNSTITALKWLGVREIVWKNGDFLEI